MTSPNNGIPYVPEGALDPAAGLNDAIDVIDALLQSAVIAMDQTAPPGSPADGDLYIVAAPATGAWTGLEDHLVRYRSEGAFWQSYTPGEQAKLVLNLADLGLYRYDAGSPGGWSLAAGLGDAPVDGDIYARRDGTWEALPEGFDIIDTNSPPTLETGVQTLIIDEGLNLEILTDGVARISAGVCLQVPVGDQTSNITAGAGKFTFRAPFAFVLEEVRASLSQASSSGVVTVDLNEAAGSVFSTPLTIDANERTSETAATPAVISDGAIADDAELTIDIDTAGTTARGLVVTLLGRRA